MGISQLIEAMLKLEEKPGTMCSWMEPRQCQDKPTHFHHAYGLVCGYHARMIEQLHPRPMDKPKKLKGPLAKLKGEIHQDHPIAFKREELNNSPQFKGGKDSAHKELKECQKELEELKGKHE